MIIDQQIWLTCGLNKATRFTIQIFESWIRYLNYTGVAERDETRLNTVSLIEWEIIEILNIINDGMIDCSKWWN